MVTPVGTKFGLHCHIDAPWGKVLALAQAGKLTGVTIINEIYYANELAKYVPYVIYRTVSSDHDNPVQNYMEYGADPRVIYQFGNEANQQDDCDHWLQIMREADNHHRKVIIFSDSVGWTEDRHWFARRRALEYARDHGHYVGLHAYGDVTGGYHPATAWDSPGAWRWFAGRFEHLYSLMPDVQPPLILNEWGAGGFQQDAGKDNWLRDIQEMNVRGEALPYLKCFNAWTAGGRGGLGFERDCLDDWL